MKVIFNNMLKNAKYRDLECNTVEKHYKEVEHHFWQPENIVSFMTTWKECKIISI